MTDSSAPHASFLVGCTAVGKTAVAHALARRTGACVLSADSMLVYRGMDIGTAKPTKAECEGVTVLGMDLARPDEPFSVGAWSRAVEPAVRAVAAAGQPLVVAGGTGLYVNALLRGIDAPPADPALRARLEAQLAAEGSSALMARAEALAPGSTAGVHTENPRRLLRLLEKLEAGNTPACPSLSAPGETVVGLCFDTAALHARIERRARRMFAEGLPEEVRRLREAYPGFSESTAGKGIGYAEAAALLDGAMTLDEAVERTVIRTRQLAKRQNTWWRHQLHVEWVQGPADEADIPRAADEVLALWRKHGKRPLHF